NALLATGKHRVRALTRRPESDQAKALAAKGAEVFKADLSNREDVKNALNGADIAFIVTNFFDPSIFPNNIAKEERQDDGTSEFIIPIVKEDTTIEIIDAETDTGAIVAKVIEEGPEKWNGKKIPFASERISFGKIAEILTKVTGRQFKLRSPNREEAEKEFPALASEELFDMYRWFNKCGVLGKEFSDISITKDLHPNINSFEQYAYKNWSNK
ncbi:4371_t:CDS:2, partial [Racocetra fulgida]